MDFQAILDKHREANDAKATAGELASLSDEDLSAFQNAVVDRYREVYPEGTTPSPDIASQLSELAELMSAAKSAQATKKAVAESAAALAEQAAALAEQAAQAADSEDEAPADDAEPAKPAEGEDISLTASAAPDSGDSVDLNKLTSNVARTPARAPHATADLPGRAQVSYTVAAAADVPGFAASSDISTMEDLTKAVMARMAGMPKGGGRRGKSSRIQAGIAVFNRHTDSSHVTTGNEKADAALIDRVCDERLLPGGSLTAAAGWCVPSEVDYSLCDSLTTQDGMWDVPTIEVNRGGLRYPTTWDYQSISAMLPGQILCEADFIAGTEKECIEAPCPDWNEFRLCAAPLCVTNDILQERAWPEGVSRFLQDVLAAQPHMINAYLLSKAEEAAVKETPLSPVQGASHQVLDSLGLLVTWYRDLYRMALNATLEVVLPHWLRQELIADFAKRVNGNTEVAEAQLTEYFTRRGARVQWVYDWQPLAVGTGTPPTFTAPSAWPSKVTALVYPAGAFLKAQRNIITLDAIYDSAGLKKNKYTALFMEDEIGLMQRCYRASKVEIPLCVSGAMGPQVDLCATT